MNRTEIHEALANVRQMQSVVQECRRFRGYSGIGRLLGGTVTLLASGVLLHRAWVPPTATAHLLGWGVVLTAGLVLNYVPLLAWSWHKRVVRGDWRDTAPALEALPVLAVGAAFSVALVRSLQYDLLFGTWMTIFGLVHCACRRGFPPGIHLLGLAYTGCGILCLVLPGIRFTDPRPMGLVFGFGELIGGLLLLDRENPQTQPLACTTPGETP